MQQGACTAVSSASNMSGTCVYAGAPFGSRRVSGVQESSSALRFFPRVVSLQRLQELFRKLLHVLHGRLAGFFSLIVVLYRAHSLPPFGWMVQSSERISIDWLEGGNFGRHPSRAGSPTALVVPSPS